jgi:hypothetical protein
MIEGTLFFFLEHLMYFGEKSVEKSQHFIFDSFI